MSESPSPCLKLSPGPGGNLLCPHFLTVWTPSNQWKTTNTEPFPVTDTCDLTKQPEKICKMENKLDFTKWILINFNFSILSFCTLFISPHCLWNSAVVDSKHHLLIWKFSEPCSLQSQASLNAYSLSSFEVIWKYQHIWINAIKTLISNKHTIIIPRAEVS